MKKLLLLCLSLIAIGAFYFLFFPESKPSEEVVRKTPKIALGEEERETPEERASAVEERLLYEFNMQVNPYTGKIPKAEKALEFSRAKQAKTKSSNSARAILTNYISRGPSNFGGRTRTLVIDKSDNTGNTILAGGVSGGVFRTTDGGASWTKVSPNDEIHNVTTIAQDPTNTNIWYYGTGEAIGNSASLSKASYYGQGIWKSMDGGVNWTQMPSTASTQTIYDSDFDFIFTLAVHPTTGDLYAATVGKIKRFNGSTWSDEIKNNPATTVYSNFHTDVVITPGGRVYAGFSGNNDTDTKGVWTSATGIGGWSRISNGIFTPAGRVVLGLAPSNEDKLFVLYDNGNVASCDDPTPLIEADLWMWDQSNTTFTDYSSKLPDETGCKDGIDPFTIQFGYDMVVSVKPDNDNFVVIGGTNAYKIEDIVNDATFVRIGGYSLANDYSKYLNHHPDIHAMVFDPNNTSVLYTGSDGGVHKTTDVTVDVTVTPVSWTSLNNSYQTLQYYHVNIDPTDGSDIVVGGAQDNGTTVGGTIGGLPDLTTQNDYAGGDGGSVAISNDGACLPIFFSFQNGQVYRVFNCGGVLGTSYSEITPEESPGNPYNSQFVTLFHLDPNNNNLLYYAAKSTLLRTTDATHVTNSNWDDLGDTNNIEFGRNENFQTFSTSWGAYDPSTSYLLMGGNKGHIYRLDDPKNATSVTSSVDITPPGATFDVTSIVTGLAIDPDPADNNNTILATYSNYGNPSIFLSTDKGASWTLVEHTLEPYSIRSAAIAYVEETNETFYFVGTARGLYSSTDPINNDWVMESPDQIGYALVSDLKYRPSDRTLLIGTHGNGMYETTVSSTLGLEDFKNISSAIKLYPNPVQNYLNVKLPQGDGTKMPYSIISLSGQTVYKGILNGETINVSQLTTGMYFLQVKTNDGRKGVKSFIKK